MVSYINLCIYIENDFNKMHFYKSLIINVINRINIKIF